MTETPADPTNGPEAAAQSRSAYLPVPPPGWDYTVTLRGPDGSWVKVEPLHVLGAAAVPPPGTMRVTVVSSAGDGKEFDVPSLREGAKAAANASKALSQIAEHEAAAATAKQKLLDTIGVEATDEKPTPKPAKTQQSKADDGGPDASPER